MKITKDGNDIAEFVYDALGRRIEKKDLVTSANTGRYYHGGRQRVLVEYDGAGTPKDLFVYGNCRVLKADYADDPGGIGGGCFNWLRRRRVLRQVILGTQLKQWPDHLAVSLLQAFDQHL